MYDTAPLADEDWFAALADSRIVEKGALVIFIDIVVWTRLLINLLETCICHQRTLFPSILQNLNLLQLGFNFFQRLLMLQNFRLQLFLLGF